MTILSPPIAFLIVLAAAIVLLTGLKRLAFTRSSHPDGLVKPYACGEDMGDNLVTPDYGQFLPFAFFFTILHVVALMVTTVPTQVLLTSLPIAGVYLVGAVIGLLVLYSK
jgi:NADH:ubiquinone oxidoreductase subunit 3 (subunit A)